MGQCAAKAIWSPTEAEKVQGIGMYVSCFLPELTAYGATREMP